MAGRSSVLFFVLISFVWASPIVAHDGGTGIFSIFIWNRLLFLASAVLGLLNVVMAALLQTNPISIARLGAIGLGSVAGFLHLGIGLRGGILLLLNGLGYLALAYGLFVPTAYLVTRRSWMFWLLLGFTAVTFAGYFITHGIGLSDRLGLATKVLELILIGFIAVRIRQLKTANFSCMIIWLPRWRTFTKPCCSRILQTSRPDKVRNLPNWNCHLSYKDFVVQSALYLGRISSF